MQYTSKEREMSVLPFKNLCMDYRLWSLWGCLDKGEKNRGNWLDATGLSRSPLLVWMWAVSLTLRHLCKSEDSLSQRESGALPEQRCVSAQPTRSKPQPGKLSCRNKYGCPFSSATSRRSVIYFPPDILPAFLKVIIAHWHGNVAEILQM